MVGFIKQTLSALCTDLPFPLDQPIPDVPVSGIVLDSRAVQPGNLFVALSGGTQDGHGYIPDAIRAGAGAIIGSRPIQDLPVPYIRVPDARLALALISAAFYGYPARQMTTIGVTGTDGKTTTSNLIYQILLSAGYRTGIISTVNATIGSEVLDTGLHVTTPEAPDVQRYLARMLAAGLTHVVLEATSHGLAQHRVTGCEFDIGVVTNITHEHLDYHGSYEAYRDAKASLFTGLAHATPKKFAYPRTAVLNRDDSSYGHLSAAITARQLCYSLSPDATLWADGITYQPDGTHFTAHGPGFSIPVDTRLPGPYNVSNCLAAIAATVVGLRVPAESARMGIQALPGIPGRMEAIDLGQNFSAIVDFAHTPNALARSIETARKMTRGRVLVVFGSAGLRDRMKRRMMAETSARLSDLSILTAEDPRTESLDAILSEMADGARAGGGIEGETFWRIPDRGEAIRFAVSQARPGDLIIACGKGHEQSMCFDAVEYPWDDRIAMRAAIAGHLGIPGPTMPTLPTSLW